MKVFTTEQCSECGSSDAWFAIGVTSYRCRDCGHEVRTYAVGRDLVDETDPVYDDPWRGA